MVFLLALNYDKNYKRLLILPAIFFVLFLMAIFVFPKVPQGIDLIGGTIIRVSLDKEVSTSGLESALSKQFNLVDLQVNTTKGPLGSKVLIQFSFDKDLKSAEDLLVQAKAQRETNPQNALSLALESAKASAAFLESPQQPLNSTAGSAILFAEDSLNTAKENFSKKLGEVLAKGLELGPDPKISRDEVGAVLSETFYSSGITVVIISFILLTIVIFAFFREVVPAGAIIAAAIFDIAGALGLMAIFQIPISLSTIPALLMLIGYSVDTDILLTARLLKREEKDLYTRSKEAMITGLTMTLTTLGALSVMLVLSYFGQINVIFQIAAVLLFGVASDIISTWFMNAPVLLWYIESKKGGSK